MSRSEKTRSTQFSRPTENCRAWKRRKNKNLYNYIKNHEFNAKTKVDILLTSSDNGGINGNKEVDGGQQRRRKNWHGNRFDPQQKEFQDSNRQTQNFQ